MDHRPRTTEHRLPAGGRFIRAIDAEKVAEISTLHFRAAELVGDQIVIHEQPRAPMGALPSGTAAGWRPQPIRIV